MKQRDKPYNKLIPFFEKWSIALFVFLLLLSFLINKLFLINSYQLGNLRIDNLLTIELYSSLLKNEGTLITIASVFIGIYFTILTLLSSVNPKSTFSMLTKKNYKSLVIYIRNAFLGSFIFLFFLLFSSFISIKWIVSLFYISLLMYVLLSALRFAILIYSILQRDIDKYHDYLVKEEQEKKYKDRIYSRLEFFLDSEDLKKERERSLSTITKMNSQHNNHEK